MSLPAELIDIILQELDITDIFSLRLTSTHLNELINNTTTVLTSSSKRVIIDLQFILLFPNLREIDFKIKLLTSQKKYRTALAQLNRFAVYYFNYGEAALAHQHIRYYEHYLDARDSSSDYYEVNMRAKTCYV